MNKYLRGNTTIYILLQYFRIIFIWNENVSHIQKFSRIWKQQINSSKTLDQLLPRPDRARISGPRGPEILVQEISSQNASVLEGIGFQLKLVRDSVGLFCSELMCVFLKPIMTAVSKILRLVKDDKHYFCKAAVIFAFL